MLLYINIFNTVTPVLSTWVVLSSSQEDKPRTSTLKLLSTTRLAGKRICLLYRPADGNMAAATSIMMREARQVALTLLIILLITFQTLLVTGGASGSHPVSSTELLIGTASAWVFTGELPSRRGDLRGANIDNKVLMTGNKFIIISKILKQYQTNIFIRVKKSV